MHRTRTAGVALAIALAIGATAASTASATKLILSKSGVPLVPGEYIEFGGGYNNLEVTTSLGPLECNDFVQSGLEADVTTDPKAVDKLEPVRLLDPSVGPCRSFTGNAEIDLASVGGPLKLRANGSATAGSTSLLVEYEHIDSEGGAYRNVECFFTHGTMAGTNSATPVREMLDVELGADLKLDRTRSSINAKHICPKTASVILRLPFAFNEEGGKGGREYIEEQLSTGP